MMYQRHEKMMPTFADGLHVVTVGRVSTINQNIGNLEAGYRFAEKDLNAITDAPLVIRRFGEQSSGMIVGRETLMQAMELIENGWANVVIMEDLSKAYRNGRWMMAFVQDCVDAGVRVIARGDNFDTWDENWQLMLNAAVLRHGMHIPDTQRRVRRSADKAFDEGGMVMKCRFGYEKLTEQQAKDRPNHPDDLLIAKIPECTWVIKKLRSMIVDERLYGQPLVDWLEENGVKPGPYVSDGKWKWDIVRDLLQDPILMGLRRFRACMYEFIFRTGKHKVSENPDPEQKHWDCLAHLSNEEFETLQQAMEELAPDGERRTGLDHPRHGVTRKDSISPHQHAVCGICGAFMYAAGSGVAKCKNSTKDATEDCWNHVQIDCELTREKTIDVLLARLQREPDALKSMINTTWDMLQKLSSKSAMKDIDLDKQISELEKESARITKAIKGGIQLDEVIEEAARIKAALTAARKKRAEGATGKADDSMPASFGQYKADPRKALLDMARSSYEFSRLLRKIVPALVIQPVQALDTGLVRPRAMLTLNLAALHVKSGDMTMANGENYVVDLFNPPVHIRHMPKIVAAKHDHPDWSYDKIAKSLGPSVTKMTVKRALGYWKLMQAEGLSEPYRVLQQPPVAASRWKSRNAADETGSEAA